MKTLMFSLASFSFLLVIGTGSAEFLVTGVAALIGAYLIVIHDCFFAETE